MKQIACVIVCLLALPGCDYVCTEACTVAVGLDVGVTNADTGAPICDATVTVTDGGYSEELQPIPDARGCRFRGAFSRPGVYSVRAEREGFLPKTRENVRVLMGKGRCCPGVGTAHLEIPLPAAP
jgi:hypothetical protein